MYFLKKFIWGNFFFKKIMKKGILDSLGGIGEGTRQTFSRGRGPHREPGARKAHIDGTEDAASAYAYLQRIPEAAEKKENRENDTIPMSLAAVRAELGHTLLVLRHDYGINIELPEDMDDTMLQKIVGRANAESLRLIQQYGPLETTEKPFLEKMRGWMQRNLNLRRTASEQSA